MTNEKSSTKLDDILRVSLVTAFAPISGAIKALVYPHHIPESLKEKPGLITTHDSLGVTDKTVELMGYLGAMTYFASNIVQNPKDFTSYIPLITNAAGGLAVYISNNSDSSSDFSKKPERDKHLL